MATVKYRDNFDEVARRIRGLSRRTQEELHPIVEMMLGTIDAIAIREFMTRGEGTASKIGIRTGFLAATIRSKNAPDRLKTRLPRRYPGGWTPGDYHVEEVTISRAGATGRTGSSAWYADPQERRYGFMERARDRAMQREIPQQLDSRMRQIVQKAGLA